MTDCYKLQIVKYWSDFKEMKDEAFVLSIIKDSGFYIFEFISGKSKISWSKINDSVLLNY